MECGIGRTKRHPLVNVLVMALRGIICGAEGWNLGKGLTAHGLRHTFASHLVRIGNIAQGGAGAPRPRGIEMTLRYAHLTPDVKREAGRLLDQEPRSE
jgi:integrase